MLEELIGGYDQIVTAGHGLQATVRRRLRGRVRDLDAVVEQHHHQRIGRLIVDAQNFFIIEGYGGKASGKNGFYLELVLLAHTCMSKGNSRSRTRRHPPLYSAEPELEDRTFGKVYGQCVGTNPKRTRCGPGLDTGIINAFGILAITLPYLCRHTFPY